MNEVVNVAILVIATMVLVCLICLLAVVTISDRVSLRILIRKQVAHAQDRAEVVERERMARRRAVIHDERLWW